MSKEVYYYRGVDDDDGLFYGIAKVSLKNMQNSTSVSYFSTPEECKKYCEVANQLQLDHVKQRCSASLEHSLKTIMNRETQ